LSHTFFSTKPLQKSSCLTPTSHLFAAAVFWSHTNLAPISCSCLLVLHQLPIFLLQPSSYLTPTSYLSAASVFLSHSNFSPICCSSLLVSHLLPHLFASSVLLSHTDISHICCRSHLVPHQLLTYLLHPSFCLTLTSQLSAAAVLLSHTVFFTWPLE
jgi:hypothetical protein